MLNIKIGTRGSKLAIAQTNNVLSLLHGEDISAVSEIITTKGDIVLDRGLHQIGGQGVFVHELDNAILRGDIDVAVHSMKDIPAVRPKGVVTAAILPRDPPGDYLAFNCPVEDIYTIGTSSTRRRAQILRYYRNSPAVHIESLRGNVDTRLAKLHDGIYDAIVLAEAGLFRLGYRINGITMPLDQFVPSPNQGTVAVVCRDTPDLIEAFAPFNDPQTAFDTGVERIIMEQVGGGCFTPQGIFCCRGSLTAEILSLDGTHQVRIQEHVSSFDEANEIGVQLREKAINLIDDAKRELGLST